MKRKITALFLLIVTLLASSHATVAFHYCGGNFHAVAIAGFEKISCCEEKKGHETHGNENEISNTPCCSNHYLEITTDDFSVTPTIVTDHPNGFQPVLFNPCLPLGSDITVAMQTLTYIFPPGNLAESGIDLLLSICILRI
jgi:hypothetical protein